MKQDNKVVSFSGQAPSPRSDLPPALVRLRDTSGKSLKDVLERFFDRTDDALFELADRAGSNKDQTIYFDAMRELRLQRRAMTTSVLQHVSRAFNEVGKFRPRNSGGTLDEVDQDSLSLVEHSDLEQQVAVDNLVKKLRNRYQSQIKLLSLRVNHLVSEVELRDSQMPLSPEVICGGVAEACSDLDVDIRATLVILKLFDRLLADTLGDFYREANHILIAEDVLPDVKRPPVPPAQGNSGARSATSAQVPPGAAHSKPAKDAVEPGNVEPDNYNPIQGGVSQATFSELSALLHPDGKPQTVTEPGTTGSAGLDTERLIARLNEVQASPGQWRGEEATSFDQQLQQVLEAGSGQQASVEQVDSDVINLVSMLFDFILEDRQLHPVMKALIGRLQIPVLKVALTDKNFFNRSGHSARKLLNELALSAIGWNEKRPGQRDPLHEKIESIVERVLSEFTNNVSLFDELLQDFTRFTNLDRRRRELIEQRLRDAEEGRARQERALQDAETLVNDVISGRDIPEPVRKMLNEAWIKYLQWVILREGTNGARWADACELTEHLVWSMDPQPVESSTRSELLRAIPAIVDDFRIALQEISWDPFATDAAVRDLELAHMDASRRLAAVSSRRATSLAESETSTGVHVQPEAWPKPAIDQQSIDSSEMETADAGETATAAPTLSDSIQAEPASYDEEPVAQYWLDQADMLRVGAWIEFTREEDKLRCKLAAFIRATGKYIFVNRSGAKVAEYYREELASALAESAVSMLDDGLIFDRALESIIDNLRNNRKD